MDTMNAGQATPEYTWTLLDRLLRQSDGASYIYKPEQFKANLDELRAAFTSRYPNIGIGYSYKTNYLPRLCVEADKAGLYAEVVSGMEYEMARHLGVEAARIIFNGPSKSPAEISRALTEGALINVDSLGEAQLVASLARRIEIPARVGLRCNLDLEWKGRESRFGLSEASGELHEANRVLRQSPHVKVTGLHCHTSFDRSAESYGRRMERLIEIADSIFGDHVPSFLDIGGGMCGPMPAELARQFQVAPPNYSDYAEAISAPLIKRYGSEGPELILEPGVGLVANVFDYVYRVEHVKQVGSRWFAVTSGAAHHIKIVPNEVSLPTSVYKSGSADTAQRISNGSADVDVVGFTCLEHDVIYRALAHPLTRGDILVTESTGAYSLVIASDFIRTAPPVYEAASDGSWKLLRRKLSTQDLMKLYTW